jgi:acetyl-CoA C-acetyltransferase
LNGAFKSVSATKLGAVAIKAALEKSNIPVEHISDVYMGNVLQAGVGQAPARQASIFAGLPTRVEAVTVNKVCASGLKAVMLAAQNVQMSLADAEVAGGMESMSRVPYYVPRAAQFPSFGSFPLEDGLIKDGLWDVYEEFLMGNCAEHSAKQFNVTREEQDVYAIRSYTRAQKAWHDRAFDDEVAPVIVPNKKGNITISEDEGYKAMDEAKLRNLKPAFVKDGSGTVTAGNASTMNDGASAVIVASSELASRY